MEGMEGVRIDGAVTAKDGGDHAAGDGSAVCQTSCVKKAVRRRLTVELQRKMRVVTAALVGDFWMKQLKAHSEALRLILEALLVAETGSAAMARSDQRFRRLRRTPYPYCILHILWFDCVM
ncbi:hypothetical protein LR48_Vigan07g019000 [Vigna angularis]|uniref:Uncharacterized protein n=1 Tax=Phaseolus angularis TaxID=3914 RepID=A0A0L9UUU9_PHAAN|nr:hypothetical protein LR48_Vigan07g019000 [Vigna angularis]